MSKRRSTKNNNTTRADVSRGLCVLFIFGGGCKGPNTHATCYGIVLLCFAYLELEAPWRSNCPRFSAKGHLTHLPSGSIRRFRIRAFHVAKGGLSFHFLKDPRMCMAPKVIQFPKPVQGTIDPPDVYSFCRTHTNFAINFTGNHLKSGWCTESHSKLHPPRGGSAGEAPKPLLPAIHHAGGCPLFHVCVGVKVFPPECTKHKAEGRKKASLPDFCYLLKTTCYFPSSKWKTGTCLLFALFAMVCPGVSVICCF